MSIKQERREGLISKILGKKGVVDVVRGELWGKPTQRQRK
jgi:hypothetical protein